MPRVSVIIPSYNHENYVAESLRSVLEQTFQDFEIVITDDGSSDKSVDEIRKFSDPRIRLFVLEQNQGACIAANHCIQHATGEYIAMLSSDDVFVPDKLEKQVRFLDDNRNYAAVFSHAQIIDEKGNEFKDKNHFYYSIFNQPNRTRHEWLHYFFFHGNCLCHPSVLIRGTCYKDIGSYDPRLAQMPDFDCWIRLCLHYDIHVLPENLIKFRIRQGDANTSAATPESLARHLVEYYIILHNYLNIKTADDFCHMFPEAEKFGAVAGDDLIPFFLAKLALERKSPPHELFGIQTLFRLLEDKTTADTLRSKLAFTFTDLIALTGSCDVFGLRKIQEQHARITNLESQIKDHDISIKIIDMLFPPASRRRNLMRHLKQKYHKAFVRCGPHRH